MGKTFFYTKLALSNIKNHRRIYIPYMISAIGTIMMFYILSSLGPGIAAEEMFGGNTISQILTLGVNVIAIFSVIFLFYTNSFIIKRRKNELGLYNILGMEKKHISKVIFLETFIVALTSIIIGLLLGIVFSKLMFLALLKLLFINIPITFTITPSVLLSTSALFGVIFLLTLFYNLLQIRFTKPIDLLHGGEFGEKEPKANWLIAILGTLCLGGGYFISLAIESPIDALLLFFVAVVLVIIGTYCLFTAGITVILKVLKRNKKFYYQTKHFTSVSGMIYRMKQNAAGLATICILSTCVLVMISTTFSLYTSMEDSLRTRFPRNVAVGASDVSDSNAVKIERVIRDEIEKAGVSTSNHILTRSISLSAFRDGNRFTLVQDQANASTEYVFINLSPLDAYNTASGTALTLNPGEVYVYNDRHPYTDSTITLFGTEYRVKTLDDSFTTGDDSAAVNDVYAIVMADTDSILAILKQSQVSDDYDDPDYILPQELNLYYGFDVDSNDPEAENSLAQAISYRLGIELEGTTVGCYVENAENNRASFMAMYGGLFFLGIFLGLLFIMALVLIIYYKQVSEGYDDKHRFEIMQNVGMSHSEVKKSIHSQILMVFFLPLVTAFIHLIFAMPILLRILALLNLPNTTIIILSTCGVSLLFALIYAAVYMITAKTYYKIVQV